MKRFGSLGAVLPFLALAAAGCGANIDKGAEPNYKFTMLADFEIGSMGFNPNPLWTGGFAWDSDKSKLPDGYLMTCTTADPMRGCGLEVKALAPARPNPPPLTDS